MYPFWILNVHSVSFIPRASPQSDYDPGCYYELPPSGMIPKPPTGMRPPTPVLPPFAPTTPVAPPPSAPVLGLRRWAAVQQPVQPPSEGQPATPPVSSPQPGQKRHVHLLFRLRLHLFHQARPARQTLEPTGQGMTRPPIAPVPPPTPTPTQAPISREVTPVPSSSPTPRPAAPVASPAPFLAPSQVRHRCGQPSPKCVAVVVGSHLRVLRLQQPRRQWREHHHPRQTSGTCTLCEDGGQVGNPGKVLSGATLVADLTCAQLNDALAEFAPFPRCDITPYFDMQAYCECPGTTVPNTCSYCEVDQPDNEFFFEDFNITISCDLIPEVAAYAKGDGVCDVVAQSEATCCSSVGPSTSGPTGGATTVGPTAAQTTAGPSATASTFPPSATASGVCTLCDEGEEFEQPDKVFTTATVLEGLSCTQYNDALVEFAPFPDCDVVSYFNAQAFCECGGEGPSNLCTFCEVDQPTTEVFIEELNVTLLCSDLPEVAQYAADESVCPALAQVEPSCCSSVGTGGNTTIGPTTNGQVTIGPTTIGPTGGETTAAPSGICTLCEGGEPSPNPDKVLTTATIVEGLSCQQLDDALREFAPFPNCAIAPYYNTAAYCECEGIEVPNTCTFCEVDQPETEVFLEALNVTLLCSDLPEVAQYAADETVCPVLAQVEPSCCSSVPSTGGPTAGASTVVPTTGGTPAIEPVGVAVSASPFQLTYFVPTAVDPSSENFEEAADITADFIEEFIQNAFSGNEATTLLSVTVTSTGNSGTANPATIDYEATLVFSEDSTAIPDTAQIDAGMFAVFTPPTVDSFITDLTSSVLQENPVSYDQSTWICT